MCKHCDTILDVLRDAAVNASGTVIEPIRDSENNSIDAIVSIDFEHGDGDRGSTRADQLADAIDNICGKRKLIEVEDRPVKPRPSQKAKT